MPISSKEDIRELIADKFWQIGSINLGSKRQAFFAVGIDEIIEQINRFFTAGGIQNAVIFTSTKYPQASIANNRIINLPHHITCNDKELEIDLTAITNIVNGDDEQQGFDDGFRTAFFEGTWHEFTPKQALIAQGIFEGIDNIKDLMDFADSTQQPHMLFKERKKGSEPHPAWDIIFGIDEEGKPFMTDKYRIMRDA